MRPKASSADGKPLTLKGRILSLFACLLAICVFGAWLSRASERVELPFLDLQHKAIANFLPSQSPGKVVLVGIDEATLSAFPEPLALWHKQLGDFLSAMVQGQAKAVGLDVVLPSKSYDAVFPGLDLALKKGLLAIRKSQALVLGQTIDPAGVPIPIHKPFSALAGGEGIGLVLLPVDSDGVVRRVTDQLRGTQGSAPTLAGAMAHRLGLPPVEGLINYSLPPLRSYIPLHQVIEAYRAGNSAQLQDWFSGKAVFLGGVLEFEDRHWQPVNLAGWESRNANRVPGVLMHIQALRSAMAGEVITPLSSFVGLITALLCTSLLWVRLNPFRSLFLIPGVGVLVFGVSAGLLSSGIYWASALTLLTAWAAIGLRVALQSFVALKERARLRNVFSGYVSPGVMRQILAGQIRGELRGEMRYLCVLFADIRGFTTLSESKTPQEVVSLLNRYFEGVMRAIHRAEGTVTCTMGDGIMAIFGAPQSLDQPANRALDAAKGMLDWVQVLNRELETEGQGQLRIGVGLHVGDAVVGHVGSSERHDYSAIGDCVNIASRLEGLTAKSGYGLVCSAEVVQASGLPNDFVELGEQAIKGHTPVRTFGWAPTRFPEL